jgi:hypothetical protein
MTFRNAIRFASVAFRSANVASSDWPARRSAFSFAFDDGIRENLARRFGFADRRTGISLICYGDQELALPRIPMFGSVDFAAWSRARGSGSV